MNFKAAVSALPLGTCKSLKQFANWLKGMFVSTNTRPQNTIHSLKDRSESSYLVKSQCLVDCYLYRCWAPSNEILIVKLLAVFTVWKHNV